MNLAKLIRMLQKEAEPLREERRKIADKIDKLDRKYLRLDDAIKALRDAEAKLEAIKARQ